MFTGSLTDNDIARFWSHVSRNGDCWEWTAGKSHNGYGKYGVQRDGRWHDLRANRVSFYVEYGRWPSGLVLHSCDNPACVNPQHLREGTISDNARDCVSRNRRPSLFKSGHKGYKAYAKITQEIADRIRAEHEPRGQGVHGNPETSIEGLARKYGLSSRAVAFIVKGEHWKGESHADSA